MSLYKMFLAVLISGIGSLAMAADFKSSSVEFGAPMQLYAISSRGDQMAAAPGPDSVIFWSVAERAPAGALQAAGTVRDMVFSADGQQLLTAEGQVRFYSATGSKRGELQRKLGDESWIACRLALSKSGEKLAVGYSHGPIRVYDLPSGKIERTLACPAMIVESMAFSPDGSRLAASHYLSQGELRVWRLASGEVTEYRAGDTGRGIAFSSDGKSLATTGAKDGVTLVELATGKLSRLSAGVKPGTQWTHVSFSPDGRYLAASGNSCPVGLWELAGEKLHPLNELVDTTKLLYFSLDSRHLAVANSTELWTWDLRPSP